MKRILLFIIVAGFYSCHSDNNKKQQILNDSEWYYNILPVAFAFSHIAGDTIQLFYKYENRELADTLSFLYTYDADFFDYKPDSALLNYIYNRENELISNNIDTMYGINYITDTIDFKNDYILISEPFYISNDIICFSLTSKRYITKRREHWVFYIKKLEGSSKIVSIYDVLKDVSYDMSELNTAPR